MFEADLLFAARETEDASRAYSDVIRTAGISRDTEGYATLQLARSLAALGKHEQALRTYRRFEDSLGDTKSAAPALLRAGTLCGGPLNDSRRAMEYFNMVAARYPASPEAELWGNGVRVQILTKCLSNVRFPSITEKSLHFGRQLGLRFSPIEPSELLAHVRCAANHTFPDE